MQGMARNILRNLKLAKIQICLKSVRKNRLIIEDAITFKGKIAMKKFMMEEILTFNQRIKHAEKSTI